MHYIHKAFEHDRARRKDARYHVIISFPTNRYGLGKFKVPRVREARKVHRPHSASPLIFSHRLYVYISAVGSLNGCPPPFQQDASGAAARLGAAASTLQAGDVNNASAQAQPFLPRRRFNSSFASSSSNSPFLSHSLLLPLLPCSLLTLPSLARARASMILLLVSVGRPSLSSLLSDDADLHKVQRTMAGRKIRTVGNFRTCVWQCRSDITVQGPTAERRKLCG